MTDDPLERVTATELAAAPSPSGRDPVIVAHRLIALPALPRTSSSPPHEVAAAVPSPRSTRVATDRYRWAWPWRT